MELCRSLISRHFSLSLLFLASRLEPAVGVEFEEEFELIRDFLLGLLDFKVEDVLEVREEWGVEVELGGGQKAFFEADFRLSRELIM